ncbi:MAG: hypothetical protein R3C68_01080 [Myxococcota bacterium]
MSRRRRPPKIEPLLGSEAFGHDEFGRPTGSSAFGESDAEHPLRGALLFGNDPEGNPRGSEAIGSSDSAMPLRGALLFGNDPEGEVRGSEAFGGEDTRMPLRGALLFGNDPEGEGRGSDAFGTPSAAWNFRGSQAFGAPEGVPDRLYKDDIGYDFVGVMLRADESSLAGIRKHPMEGVRQRVLSVLKRELDVDEARLRHGLGEDSIKWGRLKRAARGVRRQTAEGLRRLYQQAPGSVLGIGHVWDWLEDAERMHTFVLRCEWDLNPVRLDVLWDEQQSIAYAESAIHKAHRFFVFKDLQGEVLGYADTIKPNVAAQEAQVRDIRGQLVGKFVLRAPASGVSSEQSPGLRLQGVAQDAAGTPLFTLEEQRATSRYFRALLKDEVDEVVGSLKIVFQGKDSQSYRSRYGAPRLVRALAIMADLSRLRRGGWPETVIESSPEAPEESIEEAPWAQATASNFLCRSRQTNSPKEDDEEVS